MDPGPAHAPARAVAPTPSRGLVLAPGPARTRRAPADVLAPAAAPGPALAIDVPR